MPHARATARATAARSTPLARPLPSAPARGAVRAAARLCARRARSSRHLMCASLHALRQPGACAARARSRRRARITSATRAACARQRHRLLELPRALRLPFCAGHARR
eukprot:3274271-Pleurochrysis_carterae.AAC.3